MERIAICLLAALLLSACASAPPSRPENLCEIFQEKEDWYEHASEAAERWGTTVPVLMAIMYQESSYQAKARPPRKKLFGLIPAFRPSSAYGYAQATDPTWNEYAKEAGSFAASRSDFEDAVDFIGWYVRRSAHRNGIPAWDARRLYLAYHEGHGGYRRASYQAKPWLKRVADRVARRAWQYDHQLQACEERLQRKGWFFL